MRKPDVIGIGCRRCASSWLHNYLHQHPQVGKNVRGLHFFSNHYEKGFNQYLDEMKEYSTNKLLLEYSVSYAYPENYKKVAARIASELPNVKIFMTVRNPVDRAYSDYLRSIRRNEFPLELTFREAIKKYPELIKRGMYAKVLQEYLSYFPKEKIKILFYFDLKASEKEYLKDLNNFLEVDFFLPKKKEEDASKKGRAIKSKVYNSAILKTKEFVDFTAKFLRIEKFWIQAKKNNQQIYQKVLSLNAEKEQGIDVKLKKELIEIFKEDIMQLQQITGKKLEQWLK